MSPSGLPYIQISCNDGLFFPKFADSRFHRGLHLGSVVCIIVLSGEMDRILYLEKGGLLFTVDLLTIPAQFPVTCRDYSMQMEFISK